MRHQIISVEVASIIVADTPRLSGEDTEHTLRLGEVDPDDLPPILVHRHSMKVIDGLHRLLAAKLRGRTTVPVEFFDGNEDEAFIRAVRENTAHGLPLSLDDRKAAAARIIAARPYLSDRTIGTYTALTDKTVAAVRHSTAEVSQPDARVGADGRRRPLNSRDGRRRAVELIAARPEAPLREIASEAGISIGTAHDVRKRISRGEDPVDIGHADSGGSSHGRQTGRVAASSAEPADTPGDVGCDSVMIMRRLLRDPVLRHSDSGRELLRWLLAHVGGIDDWQQHIDAVPGYQADNVSELAHRCAHVWELFAQELKRQDSSAAEG